MMRCAMYQKHSENSITKQQNGGEKYGAFFIGEKP